MKRIVSGFVLGLVSAFVGAWVHVHQSGKNTPPLDALAYALDHTLDALPIAVDRAFPYIISIIVFITALTLAVLFFFYFDAYLIVRNARIEAEEQAKQIIYAAQSQAQKILSKLEIRKKEAEREAEQIKKQAEQEAKQIKQEAEQIRSEIEAKKDAWLQRVKSHECKTKEYRDFILHIAALLLMKDPAQGYDPVGHARTLIKKFIKRHEISWKSWKKKNKGGDQCQITSKSDLS